MLQILGYRGEGHWAIWGLRKAPITAGLSDKQRVGYRIRREALRYLGTS